MNYHNPQHELELAHQRRIQLEAQATNERLARTLNSRQVGGARLRAWTGMLLVRLGARMQRTAARGVEETSLSGLTR
jgi:hypothetical protein